MPTFLRARHKKSQNLATKQIIKRENSEKNSNSRRIYQNDKKDESRMHVKVSLRKPKKCFIHHFCANRTFKLRVEFFRFIISGSCKCHKLLLNKNIDKTSKSLNVCIIDRTSYTKLRQLITTEQDIWWRKQEINCV